ncbi:MAG: 50S ribosomal protein L5 [Candidatus Woesearchaeota archaeon]
MEAATNLMKEIRMTQISLNMGVGKDEDKLKKGVRLFKKISGMEPVKTFTNKRIPGWGLRPGLAIGCKVTIRKNVSEMLKRLLAAKENTLSSDNFDEQGNFSFGIPEYIDIEGMEYDPDLKIMGLEVAVTLERPGFRISKRKVQPKKIGQHHRVTKDEAIAFVQQNFNTKIK